MPKRVVPEGTGERVPVMSRTTRDLRQKLEEAAAASGRSLGQEVEFRLEKSFTTEDDLFKIFGSEENAKVIIAIAGAINLVETVARKKIMEDEATLQTARMAVSGVMDLVKASRPETTAETSKSKAAQLLAIGARNDVGRLAASLSVMLARGDDVSDKVIQTMIVAADDALLPGRAKSSDGQLEASSETKKSRKR